MREAPAEPAWARPADEPAPRRVLYLAFYYPPLGGGGVQRTVKFAKYLPEFGFEPIVVTGPGGERTRHAPLDASLAADLTPESQIYRVPQLPGDFRHSRVRRLIGLPSAFGAAWMESCEEASLRAAARHPIHVVLASMSPFETSRPAARVAQRLGVPWVADLRDPWALDEMIVYPTRWHRGREIARMRASLASASLVIMNTPDAARALRDAFPELADRTIAIPNGFDASDFEGPPPARAGDRFRVVHTGALHVGLGAAHRRRGWLRRWSGGERVAVDILTRSHVYLVRALEQWRRESPAEVRSIEVVLAGDVSAEDREVVERSTVSDLFQMPGYVSHEKSVALLRAADLLFLPMHRLPRGERARIVPGKTYEYLAAKRPILAAVPEGDARDLVLASGMGHVCEPHDVAAMLAILRERFAAKRAGEHDTPAVDAFYRQFERRALAGQLAEALAGVVARSG